MFCGCLRRLEAGTPQRHVGHYVNARVRGAVIVAGGIQLAQSLALASGQVHIYHVLEDGAGHQPDAGYKEGEELHLFAVAAHHEGHVVVVSRADNVDGSIRKGVAVLFGNKGEHLSADVVYVYSAAGFEHLCRGHPAHAGYRVIAFTARLAGVLAAVCEALLLRHGGGAGPALDDGLVKETLCKRAGEQVANAPASRGLSEDGDVVGVSAKGCDVVLYPLQGLYLVEEAIVAGTPLGVFFRKSGKRQEPEGTQPVVDGHHYNAFLAGELFTAVGGHGARADDQGSPVNPHHDRVSAFLARAPHIKVKAVLAAHYLAAAAQDAGDVLLRALRDVRGGLKNVIPRRRLPGRLPAQLAHRRSGKGNALPGATAGDLGARYQSEASGHRLGAINLRGCARYEQHIKHRRQKHCFPSHSFDPP